MERVGIGILGSGFMAQTHAKALAERPDAEIRWICGRNPQKVNDLAAQVGARGTTDLGQLLADPGGRRCGVLSHGAAQRDDHPGPGGGQEGALRKAHRAHPGRCRGDAPGRRCSGPPRRG